MHAGLTQNMLIQTGSDQVHAREPLTGSVSALLLTSDDLNLAEATMLFVPWMRAL